jgi:hypothetical protein
VTALVAGLLLIVLVVACSGTQEETSRARSTELTIADPLTEALRYIPQSAGLVAVAQTDTTQGPLRSALDVVEQLPGSGAIVAQAQALLGERIGVSLADEGAALVGAPVVVARTGLGPRARTIGAWVVPDEAALAELLSAKAQSGELTEGVPYRNWTTYSRRGGVYATRDRVLLTASDLPTLKTAITRRLRTGRVGGLTPALFATAARSGMSSAKALLRVAVSGPVLRSAISARVPRATDLAWVAALDGAGVAVAADADGVHLRARLRTDEAQLVDADLPIAPGLQAPELMGEAPVVVGLRNPRVTIDVALQAGQLLAPGTVATYTQVRDLLKRFAGVDVDADVIGTLTQDATVTLPQTGGVTLRAPTSDEQALRGTLSRLGRLGQLAGIAGSLGVGPDTGGLAIRDEGEDRYTVLEDDTPLAVLAVRDGVFVASTDPGTDVQAVADALPPGAAGTGGTPVGALQAIVTPTALTDLLVDRLGLPSIARVALDPLGTATVGARSELGFLQVRADVPVDG